MRFASAGTIVEGVIVIMVIVGLWLLVLAKYNKKSPKEDDKKPGDKGGTK